MTLDELNYSAGTEALVAHLTAHGWACETVQPVGYTICKLPGTGIELLLPSPDKCTGRVNLSSRIVAIKGE